MGDGRFRRALRRIAADDAELVAEDLQKLVQDVGAIPIGEAGSRERVRLLGTVESTTLRPRAGTPAVEAELYDGTGTVYAVWLGRREIAGVHTGTRLCVEGRVQHSAGRKTMFNPVYRIIPAGS